MDVLYEGMELSMRSKCILRSMPLLSERIEKEARAAEFLSAEDRCVDSFAFSTGCDRGRDR